MALAAPFQLTNIVVAHVGDGSTALTAAATAVFLDEYTPGGRPARIAHVAQVQVALGPGRPWPLKVE